MDIPQNRIAPSESFECTGNQRLFTSCDKLEEAGFDENHNFFLYERKDVRIMSEEIYRFIDFAAAHPELQYLVKYRGSWLVYIDRSTIIPLFARAVKVENIAMPQPRRPQVADSLPSTVHRAAMMTTSPSQRSPKANTLRYKKNTCRKVVRDDHFPTRSMRSLSKITPSFMKDGIYLI